MNIKGIHFKEQVSHLKNLHFPSEQQMQIAYLQMLKLKVLFLSSLIALAIYNLITLTNIQQLHPTTVTPSMLLSPLVGLIILGFIMHILRNTLKLMSFINRREWYTSQYTLDGHTFYSAYFQDPEISDDEKKYIPFLDKVLAW